MRHLIVFLVGICILQTSSGQTYQLESALPDYLPAPCNVSAIWYQPGNDLIIVSQGKQYLFNGKNFKGIGPSTTDPKLEIEPVPVPESETGISQGEITSWIHSADEGVWIGTDKGSLFKFEMQSSTWEKVLEKRGFSAGAIEALAEDRFGNCWIATEEDGLLVARLVPSELNAEGLKLKDPDSPAENNLFWRLWVDEITVNGESIDPSYPSLDPTAAETQIELDGEFFAIGTEAVYQYRIRGTQDSWWSTNQQTQSISLPRMAPGDFQIEVRTRGMENKWSPPFSVLNFSVPYPFYYQAWFLPVIVLAIVIVLIICYNYRVNKAREREFYLEKLIRERTRKIRNQKAILKNMTRKLELTQEDSEAHCIAMMEAMPDLILVSDRTGKLIGSGFNQGSPLFDAMENLPVFAWDYFPLTAQPLCKKALDEAVYQITYFEFSVLLEDEFNYYEVRVCSMGNQEKRLFLIRDIGRRFNQEMSFSQVTLETPERQVEAF